MSKYQIAIYNTYNIMANFLHISMLVLKFFCLVTFLKKKSATKWTALIQKLPAHSYSAIIDHSIFASPVNTKMEWKFLNQDRLLSGAQKIKSFQKRIKLANLGNRYRNMQEISNQKAWFSVL